MTKLSTLKDAQHFKGLIIGDSGAGKTCFAAGFGRTYVLDFDNKISSAAAFYRHSPQIEKIDYDNYAPTDTKGTAFEKANQKLGEIKKALGDYETIVIDSLTTLSDEAMKWIMRINPGTKRNATKGAQAPALQDYGIFRIFMKDFIQQVINLPCHVIFTAHIQIEKDETTGQILRSPMLAGKLSRELPIYFPEVWRAFTKDDKYLLQTQSDSKFTCRSQIPGIPKEVEAKPELILSYLKGEV